MKTIGSILAVAMTAATLSLGAVAPAPAQELKCLTDAQIQAAIQAGQFLSWPKVKKLAGIADTYQEVSDIKVCLRNGVPYYYVNVVSPSGEASKVVVNAIDGSN
jgi:hypothetical protein